MGKTYDELKKVDTTNFDELKEKLFKAFDRAFSFNDGDGNERVAMGEIAKAIVAIEREQREAKERGFNRLDKN